MDEETFACPIRYKPFIEFCIMHGLSSKGGVNEFDAVAAECRRLQQSLTDIVEADEGADLRMIAFKALKLI